MKKNLILILVYLITEGFSREVEIESFTPDPRINSSLYIDYGTLRVTKLRRNEFAVSGDYELKVNAGNEKKVVFEIFDRNTGHVIIRHSDKFCHYMQNDKLVVPDVLKVSNIPKDLPCPLPKGKYSVKNYVVDESRFRFVPPGSYKCRFSAYEDDKILGAIEVFTTLKIKN